ncbi:MAG: hypothetical protein ABWZ67_13995 [Solirubrobacteraceae bacterium]
MAALATLLVVPSPAAAAKSGRYEAAIRRTTGGLPHIKARDYAIRSDADYERTRVTGRR